MSRLAWQACSKVPRFDINFPEFIPDAQVDSVYHTRGLVPKPVGDQVVYVPGTGISEGAIQNFEAKLEYEQLIDPNADPPTAAIRKRANAPNAGTDLELPALELLMDFYTATELPREQQTVYLFYQEASDPEQATVYFVDTRDENKIKRLPTPHNSTTPLPQTRAFPFVYRDQQYIIYANGLLLRVDNTALLESITIDQRRGAVTEVTTNIRGSLNDAPNVPELQNNPIIDIIVFQERLFIALKSTIHWCHPGDLAQWARREEISGVVSRTFAGSFVFDQEVVRKLIFSDRSLYMFTTNQIWIASVAEAQVQFTVLPAVQSIDYLTGAIQYQTGIYFVSRAGIKFLPNGARDPAIISQNINETIQSLLLDKAPVTAAIVEDTSSVMWLFPSRRTIIIYNTKFQRWQILTNIAAQALGFSFTGSTTLGDLSGTLVSSLFGTTIGDLSPRAEAHTTVVTERRDDDGITAGEVKFIGFFSDSYSLSLKAYKSQGNRHVILQKVSVRDVDKLDRLPPDAAERQPPLDDRHPFPYTITARDRRSSQPLATCRPNRRNQAHIYRKALDVDVTVNLETADFTQLETIVVETTDELGR